VALAEPADANQLAEARRDSSVTADKLSVTFSEKLNETAFAADGMTVLTGRENADVRLWPKTGLDNGTLKGEPRAVYRAPTTLGHEVTKSDVEKRERGEMINENSAQKLYTYRNDLP
jgi:hypothetical protein